ncbi:MAG TPA: HAMP domain-containing sensor histidine kinase [Acidimicrobiia bacterium]|nr:HAMP domain-containing sensor histidine kinase [Acidimicrobiia bacterium]
MRRNVSLLVLAVTSMVAIAFVLPLGLLVRRQANDRAVADAQREARAVASALAVAEALSGGSAASVGPTVLALAGQDSRTTLFLPDGSIIGFAAETDESVLTAAAGVALTTNDDGGVEVLVPVAGADGTTVVRTFVPIEALSDGVLPSWLALGALGIALVAGAVALADRLGRSTVAPVHELADAARRLAGGDLDARVEPGGPHEVEAMGEAFNELADRLDDLLAAERESVADLSHRLRTPLTALRLGIERLDDAEQRERLLEDVDRLNRHVDSVIADARRRPSERRRTADLATVVRERFAFWRILAEEQGRAGELTTPGTPVIVPLGAETLADAVEGLLENVFSHTPPGSPFRVTLTQGADRIRLTVEDGGAGFPDGFVPTRGTSGGDSTGLGLDIVTRAARRTGGDVSVGRSTLGGAAVEVAFGPA